MRSVEKSNLHSFIGGDIGNELSTYRLPGRSPIQKLILYNPLGERLTNHWPPVIYSMRDFQRFNVCCACNRRNAIHHTVGKTDVRFYPPREQFIIATYKGDQHLFYDIAIVFYVVAGLNSKCRQSLFPPDL